MKLTVLLLCALVAFVVADVDFQAQFNDYVVKFNKKYTSDEYATRFANFQESVKRVSFANTGNGAVYALNKFSDMSTEEFKNIVLMKETLGQVDVRNAPAFTPAADVPPTLDWREKGGVTAVKDQGQCGSCWAFSATEAIESANLIAGKVSTNISLSPQQIVDCDHDFVFGCNGGRPSAAYSYIIKVGGQEGTDDYPYTAKKGDCAFNSADIEASISTYQSIAHTEASLQQNLVNLGPLSICLDAAHWQDYSSGILTPTECCPLGLCMLDHCVQLVGYNTTGNYWLVRNSWGTDWGNDGYIELAMGHNTCGLLDEVTWPSVKSLIMAEQVADTEIPKLWYMPVRGEGDRIRLLFVEAGINYQDVCVTGPALYEAQKEAPCGKFPMLEHGPYRIWGATTIMRYVGDLAGLNGETKGDMINIDLWCEFVCEVQRKSWTLKADTLEAKEKLGEKLIEELGYISRTLARSDDAYLVGNKLSRADIALLSLLDSLNKELPLLLPRFPLLQAVHERLLARPRIEKFCNSGKRY